MFHRLLAFSVLAFVAVALLAGCKSTASMIAALPPGTQFQTQTTGFKVSPQSLDAPVVFGSHSTIVTLPQPADAGPNLNRFHGTLSGVKATIASGAIGEQLREAGGVAALDAMLGRDHAAAADAKTGDAADFAKPLPRTDLK